LKKFGLATLKKNQGLVQKRNPKRSMMIKPSQQDSRISGTKGSLVQGGSQIKRKTFQKYNASRRDQIQAIEEIILEKELVNIVLNGIPKMWDAFAASMNTRKEYPTFEEIWTCYAQEESRISAKEKPQKKYDDQAFTTRFKNFRNKRKFGSRRKPNKEKDISEVQCQLSKVWSLQESLSRAKEKEGET
jgi:hypothetical protein